MQNILQSMSNNEYLLVIMSRYAGLYLLEQSQVEINCIYYDQLPQSLVCNMRLSTKSIDFDFVIFIDVILILAVSSTPCGSPT